MHKINLVASNDEHIIFTLKYTAQSLHHQQPNDPRSSMSMSDQVSHDMQGNVSCGEMEEDTLGKSNSGSERTHTEDGDVTPAGMTGNEAAVASTSQDRRQRSCPQSHCPGGDDKCQCPRIDPAVTCTLLHARAFTGLAVACEISVFNTALLIGVPHGME